MTIHKCGAWTNVGHTKDICIGHPRGETVCPKSCENCKDGYHYDPSTLQNARKNINAGFVSSDLRTNNNSLFKPVPR